MKKISLIIVYVILASVSYGQEISSSYHYRDQIIELQERDDLLQIRISTPDDIGNLESLLELINNDVNFELLYPTREDFRGEYFILKRSTESVTTTLDVIEYYSHEPYISSVNFLYDYSEDIQVGISNAISVKLYEGHTVSEIEVVANNYLYTSIRQDEKRENVFHVYFSKEEENNALALANLFYNTGIFKSAEPEFLFLGTLNCNTTDPYYYKQWGLEYTDGEYLPETTDASINVCGAWDVTKGSGVKVAVLDVGVELTHPDLNIAAGYDATGGGSNGGHSSSDRHGTNCAGVIGALANNDYGSGVAPQAQIVPVRIGTVIPNSNNQILTTPTIIADGIEWAYQHADILSNSFGTAPNTEIDDAINAAILLGRNSLGAIIVASSGNNNSSSINYPASHPDVIAVGASTYCSERKSHTSCDAVTSWGSNYGTGLSVVAPGHDIVTTDIGHFFIQSFNGTSAACPFVAGTAALIIAANPCLEEHEVRNIIEKTADKVGGYNYNVSNTNGNWNNEMGYGRVDASDAVELATTLYVQNKTDAGPSAVEYRSTNYLASGENVTPTIAQGKYTITNSGNVSFFATKAIELEHGFEAEYGSVFLADIKNINCNQSTSQYKNAPKSNHYTPIVIHNNSANDKSLIYDNHTIQLYPNPNSGSFSIKFSQMGNYDVQVVNMIGSVIYKTSLNNQQKTVINLNNNLPAGNYTVLINGNGITKAERISIVK